MNSPAPPRQRFRVGLDEIPDDVLEQIAHAGDCATFHTLLDTSPDADGFADTGVKWADLVLAGGCVDAPWWPRWRRAARWAARLLGVEVK